ncbi:MAG: minor capsid protein [Candidatus Gastranaerophilales bacterium]|nr:minor capsid protein [Candidatus Gastranaerophilales bacterium]
MANVINLKKAFYMEPEEIVKYFESKGLTTSFDWHEVYEDAHARAFTVAKMTQIDLLKDTQNMLSKAIKEGWSEGKFKKNATELFAKNGWTGFKEVTNPNGEKQTVELGTPRRIKKIFQCNMHSAYAAGRYKKQLENADVAPYLQYICVLDGKTRPEHRAMHGKVFRYDDKIWNTMYPPNGWNCRCIVRQLTQSDVDRKGLEPEESKGHLTEFTEVVGGKERTRTAYSFEKDGQSFKLIPDAGWNNNTGKAAYLEDVLLDKIEGMPKIVKKHFYNELGIKESDYKKEKLLAEIRNMGISIKDLGAIASYTQNSKIYNQPIINAIEEAKKKGIKITEKTDIINLLSGKDKILSERLSTAIKHAGLTDNILVVQRGEGYEILKDIIEKLDIFDLMKNPQSEKDIETIAESLKGKIVIQNLFMSASLNTKKATEYAKKAKEPRLHWTITANKGARAIDTRNISSKKWEEEILFDRGQKLEISEIKYNEKDRIWEIEASALTE